MLGVLERNGKEAARLEGCGRGQQVGTVSRRQPDHGPSERAWVFNESENPRRLAAGKRAN